MTGPQLPRCELTDLPRLLCDHCQSFTMTEDECSYLDGQVGALPRHHVIPMRPHRFEYPTRNRPRDENNHPLEDGLVGDWAVSVPSVILCDHGHSGDVHMCHGCRADFERVLGDVPALVLDLNLAITKEVAFLYAGAPIEADPEESAVPFNIAASNALTDLRLAFDGDPVAVSRRMLREFADVMRKPDVPRVAGRITRAVVYAHKVIDRPPTLMHYGPCPRCGEDIVQERVSDPKEVVSCSCGYHDTLQNHQAACLDAGEDSWLTVTELVSTLTQGGEPITRQRIENMIYREGLPRERRAIPKWRDGRIEVEEVWTCRLGDVRDMVIKREARRKGA